MLRGFRQICSFCVISFFMTTALATTDAVDLAKSVNEGDYQTVVNHLKTVKRSLTVKERMFQALAYEKMGNLDLKIQVLREASQQHPKVDLFKIELAGSIELKADSYTKNLNYSKITSKLYSEAATILVDLYSNSPKPKNFTALLHYYNRRGMFEQTAGLLELYGRDKDKRGKVFYTYLCEAQFKATLFSGALKSCGKLVEIRPDYPEGHIYFSKTMAALGNDELANQKILGLAGRFPASAPVQFEVGKALIEGGESEKGLDHLEKHLKVEQTDEALVLKAETQFKNGNEKEALVTYVQACKQHKEPRKPLLEKMKTSMRKIKSSSTLKKKYDLELSRCRYSYRPKKQVPKGLIGGEYKKDH